MEWFTELTGGFREYYSAPSPALLVVILALVMTLTVALWGLRFDDGRPLQPAPPKTTTEVLAHLETNNTPDQPERSHLCSP